MGRDGRSPPWSPWSRSCVTLSAFLLDNLLISALVAEMVWGWSCLSQVPVSGELREVEGGKRRKVSSLVSLVQVLWGTARGGRWIGTLNDGHSERTNEGF